MPTTFVIILEDMYQIKMMLAVLSIIFIIRLEMVILKHV